MPGIVIFRVALLLLMIGVLGIAFDLARSIEAYGSSDYTVNAHGEMPLVTIRGSQIALNELHNAAIGWFVCLTLCMATGMSAFGLLVYYSDTR